jgi:hypothetical protein
MDSVLIKDAEKEVSIIFKRLEEINNLINQVSEKHKEELKISRRLYAQLKKDFEDNLVRSFQSYEKESFRNETEKIKNKLNKLNLLIYSEISWVKLNDLMLKVKNYIFYYDILREAKSIQSRLNDFDVIFGKGSIENINDGINRYEKIVSEIKNLETRYKDERIRNFFKSVGRLAAIGAPIIFAIFIAKYTIEPSYFIAGLVAVLLLLGLTLWGGLFTYPKLMLKGIQRNKKGIIMPVVFLIVIIYLLFFGPLQKFLFVGQPENITCVRPVISEVNISNISDDLLKSYSDNDILHIIHGIENVSVESEPLNLFSEPLLLYPTILMFVSLAVLLILEISIDKREYLAYPKLYENKKLILA